VDVNTIVIIGGGFSGVATAVNLVRFSRKPLQIRLINARYPLARGVAYNTRLSAHLLNVAARNMSALADKPNHFVEWLMMCPEYAHTPEAVLRETFVPRRTYGDYLESLFCGFTGSTDDEGRVQVDSIECEAVDLVSDQGRIAVLLSNGQAVGADKVLLATGNQGPPPHALFKAIASHPAYCQNPWQGWEQQLPDRLENVFLVGTGLTMIDVFLTLASLEWRGTIYALSRNGLLPLSHFKGIDYPDFPPADPAQLHLPELVSLMQQHCDRLRQQGVSPAIIVDKLRPFTQRIWQHFTLAEKEQFLRDYKTRWNVTRHRVAQSIHRQVTGAQASGQLQVIKADHCEFSTQGDRIRAVITRQAPGAQHSLEAGLLINCTGPQESYADSTVPLFRQLFARGLVQADDVNLGIRVEANFAVIDRAGHASDWLFAMGTLLKGTLWETTAVPELRIQAARVAESILASFEQRPVEAAGGFGALYADVLEYWI
jgi:uncharacterized NAD(P)/FAD-binding protein YdhS